MANQNPKLHPIRHRCSCCHWVAYYYGAADYAGTIRGPHFWWCPAQRLFITPTDKLSAADLVHRELDLKCAGVRGVTTELLRGIRRR